MNIENNDVLRQWLQEHGYAALAELPSFEVPEEEYEKHLADVRAQGLHTDEGANQARAVYRCLTTHLGGSEKRPAAQDSMAAHLDRAARVFNQSVAVLAGKTEAHEKMIAEAKVEVLEALAALSVDARRRQDRIEEQFHLQGSGIDTILASEYATRHLLEERGRKIVWTVVLGFALVLALLGFMAVKGHAQAGQPAGDSPAKPAATRIASSPDLGIPDAYLIKFRNLQFRQDKAVIRLKDFQLQEKQAKISADEAQNEIRSINEDIQRLAYGLAIEKHIDPAKWLLDLDTLTWQPKPSEKKP